MIPLSLGHFIFGYAAGLLGILLALWLLQSFLRARKECRRAGRRVQCALCGVIYEDDTDIPLPPCPQCGHPNERIAPPLI